MRKSLLVAFAALLVLSGCASKGENARKNIVSVSPGREWKISDEFKFVFSGRAHDVWKADENRNISRLGLYDVYAWMNVVPASSSLKESLFFVRADIDGAWYFNDTGKYDDVLQKKQLDAEIGLLARGPNEGGLVGVKAPKYVYELSYMNEVREKVAFSFIYHIDVDSVPEGVDKEAFVRKRAYEVIGMKAPG